MSEDLLWQAKTERARSFEDFERSARDTLSLYVGWRREQDRPNERAIRARVSLAPPVGACAAEIFERLTGAGMGEAEATTVAAETAASAMVRRQAGAPEQADTVFDAVGVLAAQVAGGRDQTVAVADFREAIVGWRGDGTPDRPLARPVLVTFDDGTVIPDGVETAGIRETGARHSIVTPTVEAGIEAYLIARREGLDVQTAINLMGAGPGVREAVADFADDVELDDVDIATARTRAVAGAVAEAAIGQFLSLRDAGMDTEDAVATAAGGDPVAVHVIGGFIARVRDGFPEPIADAAAWSAATAAVRHGEDYQGGIPKGVELPGFHFSREFARAAIEAHTLGAVPEDREGIDVEAVRRYEWLTRHGIGPAAATRLAAVDTAAYRAQLQAQEDSGAIDAAEAVVKDVVSTLDFTRDTTAAVVEDDGDGFEPEVPDRIGDEVEQLALDHNHGVAESAVELFEKVRRYGRDEDDAREDVLATFQGDDAAVADAALASYREYRDAGHDHQTAAGLAAEVAADQMTPYATGNESTVDDNERTISAQAQAAADRRRNDEAAFHAQVEQRYQALIRDGVDMVTAQRRAEEAARENWQVEPWSAVIPRRNPTAAVDTDGKVSFAPTDDVTDVPRVDLSAAIDLVAADTREEAGDPTLTDDAVVAMVRNDVTGAEIGDVIEDAATRAAYFAILNAFPEDLDQALTTRTAGIGDADVPDRVPERGGWLARNLPADTATGTVEETPAWPTADRDDDAVGETAGVVDETGSALDHIDQILADEDADPPPLAERMAECEHAVDDVETAAQHTTAVDEDAVQAERCARWNTEDEDAASDDLDDYIAEGW